MNTTEVFLIAMLIIFTVPYLIWRLGRTEYFAPLVVVQIITGIQLGLGILGAASPDYCRFVFSAPVIQSLNGIAWWGVMVFVWIAGIELDLHKAAALPIPILLMEKLAILRQPIGQRILRYASVDDIAI
jgi:Kef-type K+ transport system membrane component KefB